MAIIALPPKFSFTGIPKFGLQRRSSILRSKYSGQGQYVLFPFAVWMLEGNLLEYDGQDAGNMRAFLIDLEGVKNQFRLPVPGFSKPLSGFAGNGDLFANAAARSTSITVDIHVAGVPMLNKGDFFTINDELKVSNGNVVSDGAGRGVVTFKPGLRKAAVVGDIVTIQNPTVLLRAADDDIATISLSPPVRQGVPNFSCIEAVDI